MFSTPPIEAAIELLLRGFFNTSKYLSPCLLTPPPQRCRVRYNLIVGAVIRSHSFSLVSMHEYIFSLRSISIKITAPRAAAVLTLAALLLLPTAALASYLPGQTLNPSCTPTDPTCVVVANTAGTFVATSTTATSTFAGNVSVSGNLAIGNVTGILKAVAGVITTALVNLSSDVTGVLGIANGGTGLAASPTYGQVLVGNNSGGYSLTATSSLGIVGSQWTTNISNIFYTTGNVGIGTSSPSQTLSVGGNGYFSGGLTLGTALSIANGGTGTTSASGVVSGLQFLQSTSTSITRSVQSKLSDTISVKDFGAAGNALSYSDGTITQGSSAFSSNSATFTSADVGKTIWIDYAGSGTSSLQTTITGFTDSHHVTLGANAATSVPYSFLYSVFVSTAQSGSGSYVPGDTITLLGGTASVPAIVTVDRTKVMSATLVSGGTGGTTSTGSSSGSCVATGTTGSGERKFSMNVTLTSGVITSIGTFTNYGQYSANPTSLSAEPVTGCGSLSGATVSLVMGVLLPVVTTPGTYSATASTLTQSSTSGSGTGATFSGSFVTGGQFTYGTDDTNAWSNAINYVATLDKAGAPTCLYAPGGIYLITSALPTFSKVAGCIKGAGTEQTFIYAAPSLSGDVFSWSEAWGGANNPAPYGSPTLLVSSQGAGPILADLHIVGDQSATNTQNAITLFDRDDYVSIDSVFVDHMNGSCFRTGVTKNVPTQAYIRESYIENLHCFNSGNATHPGVDLLSTNTTSGDATNEVTFQDVNIFAPNGPGFVLHSNGASALRLINVNNLRVEGQQTGIEPGNLVQIGDSSLVGLVDTISFNQLQLISPYLGYAALDVTADSSTDQPYYINVNNAETSGSPYGQGLRIEAGRSMSFNFQGIGTNDYQLYVAASPLVGSGITVSDNGAESSLYASIDSSSVGSVKTPSGQPIASLSSYNTSFGSTALSANTTGSNNAAFGYGALSINTTGANITAIGYLAGASVTNPSSGTFIGSKAGFSNTTGFGNVCIGSGACYSNAQGSDNTVIGTNAGYNLLTGSGYNVLIGFGGNNSNVYPTTAKDSIEIGDQLNVLPNNAYARLDIGNLLFASGLASTTVVSSGQFGIGTSSPYARFSIAANSGDTNTTLFVIASSTPGATTTLFSIDNTGSTTIANGVNITGGCFAINGSCLVSGSGAQTNTVNTWTVLQTFNNGLNTLGTTGGYQIDGNLILQASTTNSSLLVGQSAGANLLASTSAAGNIAIGFQALQNATSSSYNTALGYQALKSSATISNPGFNTAVGYQGLTAITSGFYNTSLGYFAGKNNTSGNQGTFVGAFAGQVQVSGNANVYVGYNAGQAGTTAFGNTCLGANSCFQNTQASNNIAIGGGAGYKLGTGSSNNIIIGLGNSTDANQPTTDKDSIIIGNQLSALSNSAYASLDIGNLIFATGLASTSAISTGNVGIGTTTPYSRLTVWGTDTASTSPFAVVNSASTTVFAVFDNGNATYSGSIYQSSDQRLKTDILSLDASSSLADIEGLNPVSYTRLDQEDGTNLGFIAQQVQQIFPELVSTTSATALTPNGTLTLNYVGLIAPMVKAIQALGTEIASLEQTVASFAQSFTTNILTANTGNFQKLCVQKSDGTSVCVTGDQLATVLAGSGQQSSGSDDTDPQSSDTSASTTPPIIQVNGDNPATINLGDTYSDLGATITGPKADLNLGVQTFVGTTPMSQAVIDTSAPATYHIYYVVTDANGLTSTSTRTVIVQAVTSEDNSNSDAATSSADDTASTTPTQNN